LSYEVRFQFQRQFRLLRRTCEHLINLFEQSEYYPKGLYGRNTKTAKEHILVFLWYIIILIINYKNYKAFLYFTLNIADK